MQPLETLLIVDDSESSADLYYATGFHVTARVIYLETGGRKTLLVNDLEFGRARAEARVDEVISTRPYEEALRSGGQPVRLPSILDLHLRPSGIRELTIPASLAVGTADQLRELGYSLRLRPEPFFAGRLVKRPEEILAIQEVQEHTEAAMALAAARLAQSEIREGLLWHGGKPLTSERLRREIQGFLLDRDCLASNTIVAAGDQAADPHSRGSGPLPANETIIIDILPRSETTRYCGDMTRTFVRGRASAEARRLYRDVVDAQDLALSLVRDGADAQNLHESVARFLEGRGNPNGESSGRKTGFIHATGHGIGLELHEGPRIGRAKATLRAGNVIAIEPGLYYPGVGSVRIEDAVVVTDSGHRNLNRYPKRLEV